MENSKIAIAAYCLAVGLILAVAFHAPSKELIAASEPVLTPVVDEVIGWSSPGHGEAERLIVEDLDYNRKPKQPKNQRG
jgi:hypothetical protein